MRVSQDGGQLGLCGGGLRRAMRPGRPEPDVGEDLFDHIGLVNECNDPRGSHTLWAEQRILLTDPLAELSTALPERRDGRGAGP